MKELSQTKAAIYQREMYKRKRDILIQELGGKCVDCGTKEDLQFDHVIKEDKSFDICRSFNRSLDYLREEAKKCVLRCEEHHKQKTVEQRDFLGPTNQPQHPKDWVHGTHYTRYNRGCHCDICMEYSAARNANRSTTRKPQTNELVHGTYAGYRKEKRKGLVPCVQCRGAYNQYMRIQRSKRNH